MLAGLCRRAVNRLRRPRAHARDDGFTLVEALVSIMLMSIMTGALTTFFIGAVSATNRQGGKQSAMQLAQDATELARSLQGSAVTTGRILGASPCPDQACIDASAVAAPYLADLEEWDAVDGTPAQLPTTPRAVTVNGLVYSQWWYVGKCWQQPAGGDCGKVQGIGDIVFFRVVVAVTWPENHCAASLCTYLSSTLISGSSQPVFNSNQTAQPPAVINPGPQLGELTAPVNLALIPTGGAPPVTWTAVGLPPGLSISPGGLISGTPTTVGTYTVTVSAKDGFLLVGTSVFSWIVKPVVQVATPGAQTGELTAAVTALQIAATNGIGPYSWSAAGLPPGLSIDATGKITGVPTTAGPYNAVTVKVTDAVAKTATTGPFKWTVVAGPVITAPAVSRNDPNNNAVSVVSTATGGTGAKTWSATNLPPGLAINAATGLITGTPSTGSRYLTSIKVTDSVGGTATRVVDWKVTVVAAGLKVTSPTADRTDNLVTGAVVFTATAAGGSGTGYTWTASGLPPGIVVSGTGVVAGTPTLVGTYTVTLTVRDSLGKTANFMFTWKIQ